MIDYNDPKFVKEFNERLIARLQKRKNERIKSEILERRKRAVEINEYFKGGNKNEIN